MPMSKKLLALLVSTCVISGTAHAYTSQAPLDGEVKAPSNLVLAQADGADIEIDVIEDIPFPDEPDFPMMEEGEQEIEVIEEDGSTDYTDIPVPAATPVAPAQDKTPQMTGVREDTLQSDVFYDSDPLNIPRGAQPTVPEKVNPEKDKAAKVVHVEKNYDYDDDKSVLVSARRALDLGRYDSAISLYDGLYKKNPRDPRILMGRAVALQKAGRIQSSIQMYEDLLEIQPNNIEAETSLLGLVRTRYPALALKRLLELSEKNPHNPDIAGQVGLTYADLGNMEDAVRYLGIAVSIDPNNALNYYNLAVLYDRGHSYDEAIKMYEEALSKDTLYGGGRSVPRDAIYQRLSALRMR